MRIACLGPGMLSSDLVLLQWDMGSQRALLSGGIPWSNLSPDSAPVSHGSQVSLNLCLKEDQSGRSKRQEF